MQLLLIFLSEIEFAADKKHKILEAYPEHSLLNIH